MQILHTMLRVTNMEKSIAFYTELFDMKVLRKMDFPEGRFTLVFLGYGDEEENPVIELTHNWDINDYQIGTGYGHIAIRCDDLFSTTQKIKVAGYLLSEPKKMKGGPVMAFAKDPDGYQLELLDHNCFDGEY